MAKAKADGVTPAELTDVATIDERVAAALPYTEPGAAAADAARPPAPVTPTQQWLKEARAAQAVYGTGNAISPDVLKVLVSQAIAIIEPLETE